MERYASRRRYDGVALTLILHDPKCLESNYFPEFLKAHVRRYGKKVFERLYRVNQKKRTALC